MKKLVPVALVLVCALSLSACSSRTLTGAAIGGGAGALAGAVVAGTPGAVVGAGVGAAAGTIIANN